MDSGLRLLLLLLGRDRNRLLEQGQLRGRLLTDGTSLLLLLLLLDTSGWVCADDV